jgi:hypothetical protein
LETDEHVRVLQELEKQCDSYTFYGHARNPPQNLTIMVAAHKIAEIDDIMQRFQIKNELLVMEECISKMIPSFCCTYINRFFVSGIEYAKSN